MRLTIAMKSGRNRSEQVSAERLINMYSEATDGKSNVVVHGSPGADLFATCGNGPIRGTKAYNGLLYAVSGTELYEVNESGVSALKGTIPGTDIVGMASNGTFLCIVNGPSGYLFGTELQEITDPDFTGAKSVASLNGYFIFEDGTGSYFINETPFNGENYDALDFASAEANPDDIRRVFVNHKELYLFGEETIEPNVASAGAFAFAPVVGAISEKGLASRWAVDQIDNTVFWLDQNGVVRRMVDGYNPQRISTHAVEQYFGTLSTSEAFAFVDQGHEFFVLSFDNGTWVYDAATTLWHERSSVDESRWRGRDHEYIYFKNIVGDYKNGNLYALNPDTFLENSSTMLGEMVFPPINMDGEKFRLSRLQLDLEQGEGGGNVQLLLSNDGLDFRNAGVRDMGTTGNRDARTIWRNLGQHRNLHLKFRFSSNNRRAVYAAFAEIR